MTPRKPRPAPRADALDVTAAEFEMLAVDAANGRQFAAAVAAKSKAAALRRDARAIREAQNADAIRNPVERLRAHQRLAAESDSWVAFGQLGTQIREAEAVQAAERDRKAELARKQPGDLIRALARKIAAMPDRMREDLDREVGSLRAPKPLPPARTPPTLAGPEQ